MTAVRAERLAAQRVETRLVPGGDECARHCQAADPEKTKILTLCSANSKEPAKNAGISRMHFNCLVL
jgi:hypothetical protein